MSSRVSWPCREARSERALLLAILALGLAVRAPVLNRGLGYDEAYTALYFVEVDSTWTTVSTYLAFNNHIAYSLLARLSESLLGRSEWALRLPALLLGLASLGVFWVFGRVLLGPRPLLLATVLLALSPPHVLWSVSARGYSGMILFTLLSSHFYFTLLDRGTRRDAAAFGLASVVGIYFHLYAAFVTLVQALFLAQLLVTQAVSRRAGPHPVHSPRLTLGSFGAIGGLSLLCYAPVLPSVLLNIARDARGPFAPLFPWAVAEELSGVTWGPLAALVLVASLIGLRSLYRTHPRAAQYFGWLLAAPLLIAWLSHPISLYPRFLIYFLPYYLLLFVAGLLEPNPPAPFPKGPKGKGGLPNKLPLPFRPFREGGWGTSALRGVRYVLATALIAILLYNWSVSPASAISEEGMRDASRAMASNANDSVGLCAIGGGAELFRYYVGGRLAVPASMNEFQQLARRYEELRCAYRQKSWEPRSHTEIAAFLSQHASVETFDNVVVFSYRR
ncbi:MAG TPA: glycosyltransferase family 39 protein [Chloroflexota bacterium]|nr:glycosyltransferase family 39 protein [Chloroflexota bacterium]